jgi:hypothetical protein
MEEKSRLQRRKVPWAVVGTLVSVFVALASLGYSKRSDDRSASTERELREVKVEVVGATLPVFSQLTIHPEIRAAVSASISNASLRGVIITGARMQLDQRPVGCVVGWVPQAQFASLRFTSPRTTGKERTLPLALPARTVQNVAFLFVVKPSGLYPQCARNDEFRRLARSRLVGLVRLVSRGRLRLLVDVEPRGRITTPIDVVYCTPRYRARQTTPGPAAAPSPNPSENEACV